MELWEYLFTSDQKLDLAEPSAGKQWLTSQPWGIKGDDGWWTERASSQWRHNIHALRSLVKRLKGRRLRRPAVSAPLSADAALRSYVKMFRVALDRSQPYGRSELALAAGNYRGLVIWPASRIGSGERTAADPVSQRYAEDDCDFFWQVVFLSLLIDGSPSFCRHCGQPLGATTRTGRPMKQTLCSRCRWTRWRAKQSPAAMRARWKVDAMRRRKKLNSAQKGE